MPRPTIISAPCRIIAAIITSKLTPRLPGTDPRKLVGTPLLYTGLMKDCDRLPR